MPDGGRNIGSKYMYGAAESSHKDGILSIQHRS